ncbi:MAG TPA: thrombospondin type 3 repeat-containing protein [Polyangiaceae bacterium]|jgi:hypothetical protein|nr:thrombospondin type 3 repeat-containing protein [Polyangiaceae bacterium]
MRGLGVALAAALSFVATGAFATDDFPPVIQNKLSLPKAPDCTLCHNNEQGGLGTVTTPVGSWFYGNGLRAYNESTLTFLISKSEMTGQDSDGDGVSDVTELRQGTDPNVPNLADGGLGQAETPLTLQTGCAIGGRAAPKAGTLFAFVAISWSARKRRRARRQTERSVRG